MMTGYVTRRFADKAWLPKAELIEYLVGCVWAGGPNSAGGYAHATLLVPGGIPDPPCCQGEFAYARAGASLDKRLVALDVPHVTFIYGEYDWMYWRNAADVINTRRPALAASVAASTPPAMSLYRVAQATHQQMIDNPLGFADAVLATGTAVGAEAVAAAPIGLGFGGRYGAHARVWQRKEPLPQDNDPITVWATAHEPSGK